ncbi:hypothetical protein NG799_06680 [Laspinema sp. D1]|uniref:Uncharacterized protein n=1 Tax=Laspinema palackyanum D2a TaxID=2953684 RepID=A0ABT2MNG7_9CYAN|nr:hypothetical protein [Laspinema sp. D2a]
MLQNHPEISVLRRLNRENQLIIDLIEAEQEHNAVQDQRLDALEQKFSRLGYWLQTHQQNRDFDIQERVEALEAQARIVTHTQADKIAELECLVHPDSLDGDAVCNFEDSR